MKMESKINVHIKETNLDNYLLFYFRKIRKCFIR